MNRLRPVCAVLSVLAALAAVGCGRHAAPAGAAAPTGTVAALTVRTAAVERRAFAESLRVQGDLRAIRRATVSARVPGALDALYVDDGDAVTNGQPLFQSDRANLGNQVEIERRNQEVAAAGIREAEAAVERASAEEAKAARDRDRLRRLHEAEGAVTLDAVERADTAARASAAGLSQARAALDLAHARQSQAATALRIAEKTLADARLCAPFDGVVVRRLREPGEFSGAGSPVLQVEDPRDLEVSLVLGEEWYARVTPGSTLLRVAAAGRPPVEVAAAVRSPSVHPVTRTFEVTAPLPRDAALAPGMIGEVEVVFVRREGWGVPSPAVVLRGGTSAVFVADGGAARMRPVRPGLRDDGFLELLDGAELSGARVVVEGQTFLNDGDPVREAASAGGPAR